MASATVSRWRSRIPPVPARSTTSPEEAAMDSAAAPATDGTPVISLRDVTKVYDSGDTAVHALRGIDLDIAAGESIAIIGPSGSGKSTLMHIVGCLDVPSSGDYHLAGAEVARLSNRELA